MLLSQVEENNNLKNSTQSRYINLNYLLNLSPLIIPTKLFLSSMSNTKQKLNEETKADRRISNRTIQIGTRVTTEFKLLLEKICYEERINLVELIE